MEVLEQLQSFVGCEEALEGLARRVYKEFVTLLRRVRQQS